MFRKRIKPFSITCDVPHHTHTCCVRFLLFCFLIAQQPLVGEGLLIIEVSRSYSGTPHSVWLLEERSARCRDLYLATHSIHERQTSMPPAGFEPAFQASEWPLASWLGFITFVTYYWIQIIFNVSSVHVCMGTPWKQEGGFCADESKLIDLFKPTGYVMQQQV